MNETQKALLDKGIMVLPEEIDHDAYEYVLEALAMHPEPVVLYCRGDGGGVRSAFAIVDLIGVHGKVMGMLTGMAASCHGFIWASCAELWAFPHGALAIHKTGYEMLNRSADSKTTIQLASELEAYERAISKLYARSSDQLADWWYDQMQQAGRVEWTVYPAAQLITQFGMARPISEWGGLPVVETVEAAVEAPGSVEERSLPQERINELQTLGYQVLRREGIAPHVTLRWYVKGPNFEALALSPWGAWNLADMHTRLPERADT